MIPERRLRISTSFSGKLWIEFEFKELRLLTKADFLGVQHFFIDNKKGE
jgi:hypothetical protein